MPTQTQKKQNSNETGISIWKNICRFFQLPTYFGFFAWVWEWQLNLCYREMFNISNMPIHAAWVGLVLPKSGCELLQAQRASKKYYWHCKFTKAQSYIRALVIITPHLPVKLILAEASLLFYLCATVDVFWWGQWMLPGLQFLTASWYILYLVWF